MFPDRGSLFSSWIFRSVFLFCVWSLAGMGDLFFPWWWIFVRFLWGLSDETY